MDARGGLIFGLLQTLVGFFVASVPPRLDGTPGNGILLFFSVKARFFLIVVKLVQVIVWLLFGSGDVCLEPIAW